MRIDFHRNFDKQFVKLSEKQKKQFKDRLKLWVTNQSSKVLRDHGLTGNYQGYRSINVGGDLRVIYIRHSTRHIEFVAVGSHSQLYS